MTTDRATRQVPNRREVLQGLGAAVIAGGSAFAVPGVVTGLDRLKRLPELSIASIERTTVRLPYREIPRRAMDRELPHWRFTEICEVHLRNGVTGIGETLLYYTWGVPSDATIEAAIGRNAADLMWDDGLGAGLQMALFDAVGKSLQVPVHRLLGRQVHESTPLSWWNIDMPADDMAAECRAALDTGYLSYKTKGRPWFDLWRQIEVSAAAVPPEFKIDMDFNATLLDADRAIPILTEFEEIPQIDIYESPIPQDDIEGNRRICEATRVNIAMHYGSPPPPETVRHRVCDGFVIGGGATSVMTAGQFAATADLPFWLQLVGTGITATFSLHFGAVLSHATWPAVNCHQLYEHDLLAEPLVVEQGFAAIPDRPGLGCEIDRDAVERYRVARPVERPEPERLLETTWPDGRRMYVSSNGQVNFLLNLGMRGEIPFFEKGVDTRLVPDDGSREWREIYQRARQGPWFAD